MKFNSALPPWFWVPIGAGIGMGIGSAFGEGIFSVVVGAIVGTAIGVFLFVQSKKSEIEQDKKQN